jgi:all-trans-retinol dehydrogenase (NAD+)
MLETNHGHIVTVASMAGHVGTAGLCDYCASKFAAVGFDDSLRNELVLLGKDGINTTVVCPYYINTGMFDGVKSKLIPLLETDYVTDKMLEAILTNQQVLMLPRLMYIVAVMSRLFPIRVLSYIANELFETNQAMNSFSGRKKND